MTEAGRIAVIIPHYNRREDLRECLESLAAQTRAHQAIVVDNASRDGSAEMVKAGFAGVRVLSNEENLGFAGAVNRGLQAAREGGAEYFLLLNNDTVCEPGLVESLVGFAGGDTRRGLVAPVVYFAREPERVWSSGGEIGAADCACRQLTDVPPGPRRVDYASGCALLATRDVIERVGLLDPAYFMYFEEVDWCMRAARAGLETWVTPGPRVWHKVSATLGEKSPALDYYMLRNRLLLLAKMRGRQAAWRLMAGEYLRAFVGASLRGKRARARALRRAMADFVRGRFGERAAGSWVL